MYRLRDSVPGVRGGDELKSAEGEDSLPKRVAAMAGYGLESEERGVRVLGDVQGSVVTKDLEGMERVV